jgi:hypothetical protein
VAQAAGVLGADGLGGFDFETGHDPADPVDRAILATRKAVFPQHGLMPSGPASLNKRGPVTHAPDRIAG